jgi:hypothetical protein
MTQASKQSRPDKLIVARLWTLYEWPEWNLPMQKMTIQKLLRYRSQPQYVSDVERTRKQPELRWDYGRIRFFYERLLANETLEPIDVDNCCDYGHIYAEPILLDGHHRLAAQAFSADCSDVNVRSVCGALHFSILYRRPSGPSHVWPWCMNEAPSPVRQNPECVL